MSEQETAAPELTDGYAAPQEERPLAAYAALVSAFGIAAAAFAVGLRRSDARLPERLPIGDIVLIGTATHKLSRLLTKDKVTSFLRAPFTEFQDSAGRGELEEKPRGHGLRYAVGELLVCPYCVGNWVAASLTAATLVRPRETRAVAAAFCALTISDFLQLAYAAAGDAT